MKKIGYAVAILIIALLTTGIASALSTNDSQGKIITIRSIGPDKAITSDGKIVKVIFHKLDKETSNEISTSQSSLSSVSGYLDPGYIDAYGPVTLTGGSTIFEAATWTPANQNIYVGIYDLDQETGPFAGLSGGSGFASITVPWTSSQWTYAIYNPASNPNAIHYTFSF